MAVLSGIWRMRRGWLLDVVVTTAAVACVFLHHDGGIRNWGSLDGFAVVEQTSTWYAFESPFYQRFRMSVLPTGSGEAVGSGQGRLAQVRLFGLTFGTPDREVYRIKSNWPALASHIVQTKARSDDPDDRLWAASGHADRPELEYLLTDSDRRVVAAARRTLDQELGEADLILARPYPELRVLTGASRVEVFRLSTSPAPPDLQARDRLGGYPIAYRGRERGRAFAEGLRQVLLDPAAHTWTWSGFNPDIAFRVWAGHRSLLVLVAFEQGHFRVVLDETDPTAPRPGGSFERLPAYGRLVKVLQEAFPDDAEVAKLGGGGQLRSDLGRTGVDVLTGATRVEVYRLNTPRPEIVDVMGQWLGGCLITGRGKDRSADFAVRLRDVLFDPATYSYAYADATCSHPDVGYRLWKGKQWVDVLVSFECGKVEVVLSQQALFVLRPDSGLLGTSGRAQLLKLAKKAFPADKAIQALK